MGFLFPLYLLGAAAVALPIYLHLRRKPPKDAVEFSSLMFLEPTKHQPIKRRSQLENWPLLLLRCLALLALAAMFGRPFIGGGEEESSQGFKRVVVVLDTSASLKREGLWDKATTAAEGAVEEIGDEGALALIATGINSQVLVAFRDWQNAAPADRRVLATAAIAGLEPGWSSADLGTALLAAAEMISDASADDEGVFPAEIVVISDLQSGNDLGAAAGATWPGNVSVRFVALEPDLTTNAALAAAPSSDREKFAIRIRNDPASERSSFTLVAGESTRSAVVPAGESRVFEFPNGAEKVELTGDDHPFDNTLYIAPREPAPVDLLFLGRGGADDSNAPEYYFRGAFGLSQVLRPRFVDNLEEAPSIIAVARTLDAAETARLRETVETGGRVLLVLTESGMGRTLADLTGMEPPPKLAEREGGYALLQNINFDHPSLREFRDPRWRDFTGVHFWRNRELDRADLPDGVEIVAEFDSGAPAWFELAVGNGSVFVMASSWHPRDSQLALSSKFLPLLFSIFADVGPQVGAPSQFFVGEPLPVEEGERLADGAPAIPVEPGIYQTASGSIERFFAVNLRPSESELTPMANDTFEALGIPLADAAPAEAETGGQKKTKLREVESESQQNLWRMAVLLLLGLLAAESWFTSRSPKGEETAATPVPS